jgi:hypothetical protein
VSTAQYIPAKSCPRMFFLWKSTQHEKINSFTFINVTTKNQLVKQKIDIYPNSIVGIKSRPEEESTIGENCSWRQDIPTLKGRQAKRILNLNNN